MSRLLLNGKIYTLDRTLPRAQAVAIEGNRILAVGSHEEVRARTRGGGWEALDLGGKAVVPGFIDCHVHFLDFALGLKRLDLKGVDSLEGALELVKEHARKCGPGEWITGFGWDHHLWQGGFPRREDLDRVAPENPVALTRKDGHSMWVNSLALERAGIEEETPDPPGGEIERDAQGPTGILKERALELIEEVLPPSSPQTRQGELGEAISKAQQFGLTGIHDCEGSEALADFQTLLAQGELGLRVYMMIPQESLEKVITLGLKTGFGNDYLRLGHLKVFADGSLGSQTAHMLEPFYGQPDNSGIPVLSPDELQDIVGRAKEAEIACAVHAIGDAANRKVLDTFAQLRVKGVRGGLRHRIEHAQLLHPGDIPRFKQLGITASMRPIHATSDMVMADRYWGERARYSYAWRSLLDSGARLAFGSDCPVESLDPLMGIHAAVTRQRASGEPEGGWYPQERLTVAEAVHAYTLGAAYASEEEGAKGSITPGKLADLVVLSRDIFETRPEEVLETEVVYTIFDGRVVYERQR
ncbi:MAG: amidohydrolase [Anaerolineae bacterium]